VGNVAHRIDKPKSGLPCFQWTDKLPPPKAQFAGPQNLSGFGGVGKTLVFALGPACGALHSVNASSFDHGIAIATPATFDTASDDRGSKCAPSTQYLLFVSFLSSAVVVLRDRAVLRELDWARNG
jgi:hypothetical protein